MYNQLTRSDFSYSVLLKSSARDQLLMNQEQYDADSKRYDD